MSDVLGWMAIQILLPHFFLIFLFSFKKQILMYKKIIFLIWKKMPWPVIALKFLPNNVLLLCLHFLACDDRLAALEREALRSELEHVKKCKPSLSCFRQLSV